MSVSKTGKYRLLLDTHCPRAMRCHKKPCMVDNMVDHRIQYGLRWAVHSFQGQDEADRDFARLSRGQTAVSDRFVRQARRN